MNEEKKYFYLDKGKTVQGPVTADDLRQLFTLGDFLYRCADENQWKSFQQEAPPDEPPGEEAHASTPAQFFTPRYTGGHIGHRHERHKPRITVQPPSPPTVPNTSARAAPVSESKARRDEVLILIVRLVIGFSIIAVGLILAYNSGWVSIFLRPEGFDVNGVFVQAVNYGSVVFKTHFIAININGTYYGIACIQPVWGSIEWAWGFLIGGFAIAYMGSLVISFETDADVKALMGSMVLIGLVFVIILAGVNKRESIHEINYYDLLKDSGPR